MATFLSFGGGVQSCAIAALLLKGDDRMVYKPDLVLFADTGAEPDYVYFQVETVFARLREAGYQCEIVQARESILSPPSKGRGGLSTLPYFTANPDGSKGMLRRQCTREHKIAPLHKRMREYLGLKPYQRSKQIHTLLLGISADESQRATQPKERWIQSRFPLLEAHLNRVACAILAREVFGFIPQKSSCFMYPFTHPQEWERRRSEEPELFQRAVDFDESLNDYINLAGVKSEVFIHPARGRLKDVVNQQQQLDLTGMQRDCGGHCWT